jgi:hypothetical protein
MLTAFLWAITQRVVVIHYRRFGTTHQPRLLGSIIFASWPLNMRPIGCPETSARNHDYALRNSTKECCQTAADAGFCYCKIPVRPAGVTGTIRWMFFSFVFVVAFKLALGFTQPPIKHVRCLFSRGKTPFRLHLLPSLGIRSCWCVTK